MLFTIVRFAALIALAASSPVPAASVDLPSADLTSFSADALNLPLAADARSQPSDVADRSIDAKASPDVRASEGCNPMAAISDLSGAVPTFLSANGGFTAALDAAVADLEPCTIEYFGDLILGAGKSPLGSLCR